MDLYTGSGALSIYIFYEIIPVVIGECGKQIREYMNQAEMLSDYVLRVSAENETSLTEIARIAKRKGFSITQGYISKIISGAAQNISVEKLRALAAGLNRPEEEVFAVARGGSTDEKIKDAIASAMFFKYSQLGEEDKAAVATLLKALDREIEERLHAVFEYAVRKRWLRRNPFDFGAPLINKSAEAIRERIPTEEEAAAILDHCTGPRAHLRLILMMIRDTGIRPSELFRARVEDLDFEARTLEIGERNSKTNRRRFVGLTSDLISELRRHLMTNHLQPSMPLIGIKDNFRRSYRTACRLAGVEGVTPYAWRHLFGTDLHRAKIPPKIAMKVMGHVQDATHMRYVNDDQKIAAQAAADLEEYRKRSA